MAAVLVADAGRPATAAWTAAAVALKAMGVLAVPFRFLQHRLALAAHGEIVFRAKKDQVIDHHGLGVHDREFDFEVFQVAVGIAPEAAPLDPAFASCFQLGPQSLPRHSVRARQVVTAPSATTPLPRQQAALAEARTARGGGNSGRSRAIGRRPPTW